MRSNYKKLGQYIKEIDIRNSDNKIIYLRGISSVYKKFIKSKANTIGTDMSKYKIVNTGQFAFNPNTARMGDKIPIALNSGEPCIVSQIYPVFEIIDEKELLPEYLMMWFRRSEFDRYARFKSHGSAREIFDWNEMCDVELPVPDITKQQEIIDEYNTIKNRIALNNSLIGKLEEAAQAVYRQWFIDGIDMENLQDGWKIGELGKIIEISSGKAIETKRDFSDNTYRYPVYGAGNVMGYTSEILFNEKILSMGRVGTHGVIQRINFPCWTTDNTLVIKSEYYEYVYQILKNLNYDEINRGGVQGLITQTDIKNSKILFPDTETLNNFEDTNGKIMQHFDLIIRENIAIGKMKDLILSKMADEG